MSRRSEREIFVLLPPDLLPLTSDDPRSVGPHVLIGRVGAGRAGTVYAGVNPTITADAVVAVKTLDPSHLTDEHTRSELDRRLRALVAADGRCYVPPLSHDAFASPPWLAMPYVSGIPLAQYARKRGPIPLGRLIALSAGLAEGLAALHHEGIAHGDLKPSNILLGSKGPRILDCALPGDESMMRQSAAWLAPERHQGVPPTPASDVFAWGAVIAFSGTGRLPYGLGEPHALVDKVVNGQPDLEGLPVELLPLVRRCLAKEPGDRPSVRELIGASIAVWEATVSNGGDDGSGVPGTAVTRLLSREWPGIVEPVRIPRVVHLDDGTVRPTDPEGAKPKRAPRAARRKAAAAGATGIDALSGAPGASSYVEGRGPGPVPPPMPDLPAVPGARGNGSVVAGHGSGSGPQGPQGPPGPPGGTVPPPGSDPDGRTGGSNRKPLLIAGGAVLVVALLGGAAWAASGLVFDDGEPKPSESASESEQQAAPTTLVVRFAKGTQESTEGPWAFTEVEETAQGDPGDGADVTPEQWSERWTDAKGAKPMEAAIAPDTEVACAKFCLLPGQAYTDDAGKGTYEVQGSDFTNYLAWGDDVIAEVEFAEGSAGDGPREIVRVTELFAPNA